MNDFIAALIGPDRLGQRDFHRDPHRKRILAVPGTPLTNWLTCAMMDCAATLRAGEIQIPLSPVGNGHLCRVGLAHPGLAECVAKPLRDERLGLEYLWPEADKVNRSIQSSELVISPPGMGAVGLV